MGYKEMSRTSYVMGTMINFIGIVFLAIVLEDIALIFEFLSAFTISCIAFIFPGVFYLMAEKKFASPEKKQQQTAVRREAYIFCVLGVLIFLICLGSNIAEFVQN